MHRNLYPESKTMTCPSLIIIPSTIMNLITQESHCEWNNSCWKVADAFKSFPKWCNTKTSKHKVVRKTQKEFANVLTEEEWNFSSLIFTVSWWTSVHNKNLGPPKKATWLYLVLFYSSTQNLKVGRSSTQYGSNNVTSL